MKNRPVKFGMVTFTTKGQVVIPARLRKEMQLEPGTRASVEKTKDGILLRPVTCNAIDELQGAFAEPGGRSLKEEWAEYKREERALEERRFGSLRSR